METIKMALKNSDRNNERKATIQQREKKEQIVFYSQQEVILGRSVRNV
jgi:hypothetical protein